MQPKNLSNMAPEQYQKEAEANREFERLNAHQYYEAGMLALHKANEVKEETLQLLLKDARDRRDLQTAIKLMGVVVLIYGAVQSLIIYLLVR
jgi:hypothetical protein